MKIKSQEKATRKGCRRYLRATEENDVNHTQGHKANAVFAPKGAWQSGVSADFFALGYDAFGSLLPGRNYSSDSYRFGFNGKENDNEVHGATGMFQDYGMRAYDTRLARFFAVDPIAHRYAMLTPYQFASNSPIEAVDLDGLERFHFVLLQDNKGNPVLRLIGVEDIVDGGLFTHFGMEYLDHLLGIPPVINDRQEFVVHVFYKPIVPGLIGPETQHKQTVFPELEAALEAVASGEAGFTIGEKIAANIEVGMGLAMPAEGAGSRATRTVTSSVKQDARLLKLAKQAFPKGSTLSKEANELVEKFSKGVNNPGKGTRWETGVEGIFELRGEKGARVYARWSEEGFDIVAYSSKGTNQDKVFERLTEIYGKKK